MRRGTEKIRIILERAFALVEVTEVDGCALRESVELLPDGVDPRRLVLCVGSLKEEHTTRGQNAEAVLFVNLFMRIRNVTKVEVEPAFWCLRSGGRR